MAVALNFSGGGNAESGTMTLVSGQIARARFTAFAGSASLKMKIVAGGATTLVTVDDQEDWNSPALPGDTVSLVYDGQGNPASAVAGTLEAIAI